VQDFRWPEALLVVRHGESAGNVAREAAIAAGRHRIELGLRDVDVPLSPRGELQAEALGRWLARRPTTERPDVLLASPFLRAKKTAEILRDRAAPGIPIAIDERLRERDFGILEGLTRTGMDALQPEQAMLRSTLGKFYHRPPGGESWCDILLRLRSFLADLRHDHADRRVLVVAHSVVVLCLRALLESLSEAEILAIDEREEVANASLTTYARTPEGSLALRGFNFVAPLEEEGAEVTCAPDAAAAQPERPSRRRLRLMQRGDATTETPPERTPWRRAR
jgi:2,3-bisphosphoglycerate-dependent phosphoglycerate mutase